MTDYNVFLESTGLIGGLLVKADSPTVQTLTHSKRIAKEFSSIKVARKFVRENKLRDLKPLLLEV